MQHSCRHIASPNSILPSPPFNSRLKNSSFILLDLRRALLPRPRAYHCSIKSSVRMVERRQGTAGSGAPNGPTSPTTPGSSKSSTRLSATSSTSSTVTSSTITSSSTPSSAASPMTSLSSSSQTQSNLSGGVVAGVAIGCFVVGALIALGLSLYFFRRQRTQRPTRVATWTQQSPPGFTSDKKMPPVAVATSQRNIDNDIDSLIPQEADDNTVRGKASTLFDQFELHVENYYRDVKVSIPPTMESELSRFSSPHLSEPLVAFLNSTSRPMTLIKHSLAFHVMSLTSATGESARTLLPRELVGMVRTLNQPTPTAGL
jgi:hypothetical protein